MRGLRRRISNARQRARHGVSREDAWSFDHYLAGVIAEGVEELRRQSNGHPFDLTPEEWDDILARIETGFAHYHDHEEWLHEDVQDAMTLFAEWFPHLWD